MAFYRYQAQDVGGAVHRGHIEAVSAEEALRKIKSNKLYPLKVRQIHRRRGLRVPEWQVIQFFQDLAGLLDSGVPMDRALALTCANQKHKAFQTALRDIVEMVQKGSNLSEALGKYSDIFGEMAPHMVKAGEWGGSLKVILLRIAEHMEQHRKFKQKLISALIYPLILLSMSCISIVILLIFVIPKFAQIFQDLNQDVPGATQLLLQTGIWLREYSWILPFLLAGAYWGGRVLYGKPKFRILLDRFVLKIPYVKTFFLNKELSHFFRTLGTLLQGGVPMLRALQLVEKVLINDAVKEAVAPLRHEVKVGRSLSWFFMHEDFFPSRVGATLCIAEEQGKLADGLIRLGEHYQSDFQQGIERLTTFIEPAVIVFTGLFIGLAVLSMFSAIFGITDIQM